jgi:hypothetical protein
MDDKKEKMEEGKNYVEKLFPRIKDIKDEGLRNKVVNVWLRAWKMSDYKKIEDHSAYEPEEAKIQLSNVDHTNQVVEGVIAVANVVDRTQQIKINIDYLIAGAILHDIDKILLYHKEKDPVTPYGRLFAHTSLAIFLALEQGLPLEIAHAMGAHSRNFSAVPPKTHEALIISRIDSLMMANWIMSKKVDISFK